MSSTDELAQPTMDVSGETVSVVPTLVTLDESGQMIITMPDPQVVPLPPPTISMADILAAAEIVKQREDTDRDTLNGIALIPFDTLKAALIRWATSGFPNAYTIHEVALSPPDVCSDGVSRNLDDYITFVSGRSIREHVAALQTRILDVTVSFANMGAAIAIVVSK